MSLTFHPGILGPKPVGPALGPPIFLQRQILYAGLY